MSEERPLSDMIAQGWELRQYSASIGDSGALEHCFLVGKGPLNKILRVRKKMLGEGLVTEEMDV